MARKYFYFDYDYYGVSFCEEEITTESEERVAYRGDSDSFTDEVAGILQKLFCEGHQSSIGEHSYQGCDMTNTQDTNQEPEETRNVAETSEESLFTIPRKPYKFTPGQLWELRAVFEETHYPDTLRRKELAELMNVDEQKIKDWFNNKRAKLRKIQREILKGKIITPTWEEVRMKTLAESKKIVIFQEQVGDGLFWDHQNFDAHAGQDSPLSLLFH
ncbi:homeobox protein orthopedia B-like [Apodemus sylvaticus]|uniref:homeobox protein orthopedia B-like n=1 Tax=Apodemus sylvaticus TaxID=10129 RepID=UPI0022438C7D|nr:homeobox protein orthopedia B-like [Apodemus sylvaticus]